MTSHPRSTPRPITAAACGFAAVVFAISWWRWWTFQYETFDLAFYVQALWLALRGHWHVSLLNVPLLGNHAEPIVFLAAPLFALWPHPMLLVGLQTLAIASMPFTAWRIARRLELAPRVAALLALASILMPATGFVALHEFHPEALAAPLLLLLIEARMAQHLGRFWLWFAAVAACKENLAILLVGFCAVHALLERRRGAAWLLRWNAGPALFAATWLAIYLKLLGPALNAGNVDYLELYSHLGRTAPQIAANFFREPQRAIGALGHALAAGDLVWALLLPLLALPLLRPRWLIIAAPLLLQHLLSWRASEWSVRFHYAAPFIPLFWIASAEALARRRHQLPIAALLVTCCAIGQFWIGPSNDLVTATRGAREKLWERALKAELVLSIRPDASVTAPLPYLSHLATRHELFSLHHVLKGLKTLSRAEFQPPAATEAVLVDFADSSTFNVAAGYYHPQMRTADLHIVPSSDRLLHNFLRQQTWREQTQNALHLYTRGTTTSAFPADPKLVAISPGTALAGIAVTPAAGGFELHFAWELEATRETIPWMMLVASEDNRRSVVLKGACAPTATSGRVVETWLATLPPSVPIGSYDLQLIFYNASLAAWSGELPPEHRRFILRELSLGAHVLSRSGALAP